MRTSTKKLTGAALATTAAMLFAFAPTASVHAEGSDVHCMGINACKGQGACKTADNGCKGQNACKGHGWVSAASEKECTDKGGSVAK
ncbi:MAG: hypothetical protein U1F34_05000 [Gammaproteobacteria bacterium]